MVAVTSTDAYPFLAFSDRPVTLRIQEQVLSGGTVLPDSKEIESESSKSEASPSGVFLVPRPAWKCVPIAIPGCVDIFKFPGCHLLQ